MQLKRDSPTPLVDAVQLIENRSDRCFDNLSLYAVPRGEASWGILTYLVLRTEDERRAEGHKNYDVKLINLSRRGALVLRWIQEKASQSDSDPSEYTWTPSLARSVSEAISVAGSYDAFLSCFPMWHRNRLLAELISASAVRFTVPGGAAARRVSAYHKGLKPDQKPTQDEGLTLTAEQERERDKVLSQCFYSGDRAIRYPEPTRLYLLLLPCYRDRLKSMFRRGDVIDLGPYTVGDLKQGYAALATIFSVHEDLCFRFGVKHEYPANSCVVMRTTEEWADLVSRLSGLGEKVSAAIVSDLTLRDRFWDLHVQPFFPVGGNMLAVAPQFPLYSRADENILRVCGHRRRSYFDEAGRLKEAEMRDDLLPACPARFLPRGRVSLPIGLPDVDFLLTDEDSRSVVVAELKWLSKPQGWHERVDRDSEFDKGLQQLSRIKGFLKQNPSFLSQKCILKRRWDEYAQVAFVLVARDHFSWPDTDDFIVSDYEVFKQRVNNAQSLSELIDGLKSYEWLPVEGAHFEVKFDPAGVCGVSIESEIFYRIS
jgi:hypothetical protein